MYIFLQHLQKGGGGLKSTFFPSALKKGVYTLEHTHHPHIISTLHEVRPINNFRVATIIESNSRCLKLIRYHY